MTQVIQSSYKIKDTESLIKKLKEEKENQLLILINFSNFSQINNIFGVSLGNLAINKIGKYLVENHHLNFMIYRINTGFVLLADDKELLEDFKEKISKLLNIHRKVSMYSILLKNLKITIVKGKGIQLLLDAKDSLYSKEDTSSIFCNTLTRETEYEKDSIKKLFLLKNAINSAQGCDILPMYQPIVDAKGKIVKFEVLMRIVNNSKIIPPSEFIMFSKKIKLYNLLTLKVIEKALIDFKDKENVKIAFNISYSDIKNSQIKEEIFKLLDKYNAYKKVVFEIIEDEKDDQLTTLKDFILKLKEYGSEISIDDFCSGYTNFKQIIEYDIDYLKIDGEIVKDILIYKENYEIVKMIVHYAKKFNIKVIAEYIETKELAEALNEIGVDLFQGYYFYKPMDINKLKRIFN